MSVPGSAGPTHAAPARSAAARPAAWVGIVASLVLIPVTVFAYTTASAQVTATSQAVDDRLAQALSLVTTASQGADRLVTATGTIAQAADVAASGTGSLTTALNEVASISPAYQSFRASYQPADAAAHGAVERIQTIAAMLPEGLAANVQGAIDRLEARAGQLQATFTALLDAPTTGLVANVAATIRDLARGVETALIAVASGLDTTAARLDEARTTVSTRTGQITLALSVLAVAIGVWLVYAAVLNVALLRLLPGRRRVPRR